MRWPENKRLTEEATLAGDCVTRNTMRIAGLFSKTGAGLGVGITGMRERIRELGGKSPRPVGGVHSCGLRYRFHPASAESEKATRMACRLQSASHRYDMNRLRRK